MTLCIVTHQSKHDLGIAEIPVQADHGRNFSPHIRFFSVLTLSQTTNFSFFELREFADDNFEFDKNVRKFLNRVENTVGKGEIACYEQFLLFP